MSLRLCMLFIMNKHLYAFYIYMRNLSRAELFRTAICPQQKNRGIISSDSLAHE